MAKFTIFGYTYSDERTQKTFSDEYIEDIFERYGCSKLECIDQKFTFEKIKGQLTAIRKTFEEYPKLPKTVLDLGCGNAGNKLDQRSFKNNIRGAPDYSPWISRILHDIKEDDKFECYGVERIVGVDIGELWFEKFECYSLDAFQSGALDKVPGKFGLIIAGAFFNSSRLSYQKWGDTRNDFGNSELTSQLQKEIEPALDNKLFMGKNGIVLYNEH